MSTTKTAITFDLDQTVVDELDLLVEHGGYPDRSRAVQAAIEEFARRWRKKRIAEEAAKLDPAEEQALGEEGMRAEEWPGY